MKPSAKSVQDQIDKQNDQVYGDEARGGQMESSEDVQDLDKTGEETFGNVPVAGEPFFISDEADKDERDLNTDEAMENLPKKNQEDSQTEE